MFADPHFLEDLCCETKPLSGLHSTTKPVMDAHDSYIVTQRDEMGEKSQGQALPGVAFANCQGIKASASAISKASNRYPHPSDVSHNEASRRRNRRVRE